MTIHPSSCTPGGIGYALATEFHDRGSLTPESNLDNNPYLDALRLSFGHCLGFHAIATARKENVLKGLREKGMSAVRLEMTDEASIAACCEEVGRIVDGKLDILVNNA